LHSFLDDGSLRNELRVDFEYMERLMFPTYCKTKYVQNFVKHTPGIAFRIQHTSVSQTYVLKTLLSSVNPCFKNQHNQAFQKNLI
jgi:hypothetical protein